MKESIQQFRQKLKKLEKQKTPEKVDVLVELAWNIGYDDLQEAHRINEQAGKLASELGYDLGLARVIRNNGFYYYTQSDFEKALRVSLEAVEKFNKLGEKDEQGNSLGIIGLIYWSLGNFELALKHLHTSEKIFGSSSNNDRLPWTFTTLGGVYENLGDYEKARKYQKQSLKLFRTNGDRLGEARALSGLGTVYIGRKQYDRALDCHMLALKLFQELKNELGESRAYNDLGSIYQLQGNFDEALKYHQCSLGIRRKLKQKHAEITSLLNLGKLYNQIGNSERALEFLKKALKYAEETTAKGKLYLVHEALSETYEKQDDLRSALQHLKSFEKIKNQVMGDEAKSKLKNLEIQFEVEKSQKEAEIHRLRNIELKEALDNLRETQVQLVQTEKMASLGQLTAGLAHEINSPIGAIKSSADISLRALEKIKQSLRGSRSISDVLSNPSYVKPMDILEKNSQVMLTAVDRVSTIVNSLKNFARLDESEYKKADIHEGIESTLMLIQHEITNGIEIKKRFGRIPPFGHYPNQMNQVFLTLLRNAIQAIDGEGGITIKTDASDGTVSIVIADTGRGMPDEIRDSLFDLSFTTRRSRVGVGMGLYNAHNIIERHGGTIKVKSELGKGSEFLIKLPVNPN